MSCGAASTPFCSGTTQVFGPMRGLMDGATSGTCHALTATSTASTGPMSSGESVALAPATVKSPWTLLTRRPPARMASRWAPRAMKVTSLPACANRPPK